MRRGSVDDAEVDALQAQFPGSEVPRGTREMDPAMVRQLADSGDPLTAEALAAALASHAQFVDTGGEGGHWNLLSVSGIPLCVYTGAAGTEGEQLVLRLKRLLPGEGLQERNLRVADLSGSVCDGVVFRGATLDHSVAIDAFFDGADFSGASLRSVDFSGSSLRGARFVEADLRGADFEHTDCTGADFRGAKLDGARFPGAILVNVAPPDGRSPAANS